MDNLKLFLNVEFKEMKGDFLELSGDKRIVYNNRYGIKNAKKFQKNSRERVAGG